MLRLRPLITTASVITLCAIVIKAQEGSVVATAGTASVTVLREKRALLDGVLDRLQLEEQRLASEIIELRRERDSLDDAMMQLAGEYRTQARLLFKQRLLTPDASMLLLPQEHRRLALRRRLFDRFAEHQMGRARRLAVMMDTLAAKDRLLESRALRQRELIAAKSAELVALAGEEEQAVSELATAREADVRTIAAQIARLAEKSRPAASGKPEKKESKGEDGDDKEIDFNWPVSGRTIVQGYGERVNPKTSTITLNPGINISAKSGSGVKVAADGIVSLVTWLPSFGTVVIVEHDGKYRTVYANLASALVSRGRRVSAGQKIGIVGEAPDGEYLHFEVWRGRTRRDPMTVLK